MGAIAALLALGGIVALAAYSAGSDGAERPGGAPPAGGGPPALPPPPQFPSHQQGSHPHGGHAPAPSQPTPAPAPTPATHTPGQPDPYTSTPVPSHCPPGTNLADPTARALCGPSAGQPSGGNQAPVVPVTHTTPAASSPPPDLAERVRAFLASDPSPEQIEELATQLERAGLSDAAQQLRQVAAARRLERASAPAPTPSTPAPTPTPSTPAPAPSTPAPSPGPSSPAGTHGSSSSSATEPGSSSRPAGSDEPHSARQLASQTAAALQRRLDEIRRLTRRFQNGAHLTADGEYGPRTQAALTHWAGRPAPRPWVGSGRYRYNPQDAERGDGTPLAQAVERAARALFRALVNPEGEARPQVEQLQRIAGLTVDGKYGEQTRAALVRLGVTNPPRAFQRARRR